MLFDLSELEAPPAARAWALADEEARRAISEDLDATLFVEAGAGSGKTSAMVERIVQLVRCRRAELRQIAAVTFTEAAAAELRTRVRRSLATAAGEDGDGSPASVALAQIDEAAIGTIHGFCQRLLAEHPLEAGLPPGFVVLDEVRASIAWRARWASTLDLLVGEDGTRQLVAAAWVLGMDHRHLETIRAGLGRSMGPLRPDTAAGGTAPGKDPRSGRPGHRRGDREIAGSAQPPRPLP